VRPGEMSTINAFASMVVSTAGAGTTWRRPGDDLMTWQLVWLSVDGLLAAVLMF